MVRKLKQYSTSVCFSSFYCLPWSSTVLGSQNIMMVEPNSELILDGRVENNNVIE